MSAGRRQRVLLVCGSLPPMRCGVGDYTAGLAKSLAGTGELDVAVLTSRFAGRTAAAHPLGVEVLEPIDNWRVSSLGPALAAVRAWQPDVVHLQHPAQGYDGALPFLLVIAARWLFGRPLVATLHEPVAVNRTLPWMTALIRSAGAVVIVRPNFSDLTYSRVRWTFAGKDLRYIPNATSLPRMERTPDRIRAVRERYGTGGKALVAYFGFIYPSRGVHQLFDIADPARHHLVIVGGRLDEAAAYHDEVSALARQGAWSHSCTMAGFLPEAQAAEVLACADAVVLPFVEGGGNWNTSIHGARLQGTLVVTTSRETRGYDAGQNVYCAEPGGVAEMREALVRHLGTRREPHDIPTWDRVAAEHLHVYARVRRARGA